IPFNTLYEFAESLADLIKDLICEELSPELLVAPRNSHSSECGLLDEVEQVLQLQEIRAQIEESRSRLNDFADQKFFTLGIAPTNSCSRQLLKKATGQISSETEEFCRNLKLLEMNSLFDEGLALAETVKNMITEQKSVLIVSPNHRLTNILKAEFPQIHREVYDSCGKILAQELTDVLLSQILNMMEKSLDCASVLSFLKICPQFREDALDLEFFLRQKNAVPNNIFSAMDIFPRKELSFRAAAEKMPIINAEISEPLFRWFETLRKYIIITGLNIPLPISPKLIASSISVSRREFVIFFRNIISSQASSNPVELAPGVTIFDLNTVQLLNTDLTILTDINEESWGRSNGKERLLQTMKRYFGIRKGPEKLHLAIFMQLLRRTNVLMTRSIWIDGDRRQCYRYVDTIDPEAHRERCSQAQVSLAAGNPIPFTAPSPDISQRPKSFWVSDIDLLLRNPYAFYAKKILRLSTMAHLNELENIIGNCLHKVLECFGKSSKRNLSELLQIAQKHGLSPRNLGLWYFRLNRIFSFIIRQMNNSRIHVEIEGKLSMPNLCEVKCKADRIDVGANGQLSIIDYKTGHAPSVAQVTRGEKMQLPLAAIIAKKGGFGLKETVVESLFYWELGGQNSGGRIICVAQNKEEVNSLAENIGKTFEDLIDKYNVSATAYDVNPEAPWDKVYNHLARLKEWYYG
ncbi:MAG: PD-(D/E)XK nuclease family protein, partial [Holosporaceae bacterium]|nr:PD-(D/E)XK nuclease family protein [Holosporaceae bacterium]